MPSPGKDRDSFKLVSRGLRPLFGRYVDVRGTLLAADAVWDRCKEGPMLVWARARSGGWIARRVVRIGLLNLFKRFCRYCLTHSISRTMTSLDPSSVRTLTRRGFAWQEPAVERECTWCLSEPRTVRFPPLLCVCLRERGRVCVCASV